MVDGGHKESAAGIILPTTYDDVVARYATRIPQVSENYGLLTRFFGRGPQATTNIIGWTLIMFVLAFIVMLFR